MAGRHRVRPRGQARGPRRGPRRAGEGGTEGDRRVHRLVPHGRGALLRPHRQGRRRVLVQGRDREGVRQRSGSHPLPVQLRRGELAVLAAPAAPAEGARDPGHRQVRRSGSRRVGGSHQPRPREAAAAAGRRARAARARGFGGRRRIYCRVFERGAGRVQRRCRRPFRRLAR